MFYQAFVEHPRAAGETYFQHQKVAFGFGAILLAAGFAALVHALVPCFFETTASRAVSRLQARMAHRHSASIRKQEEAVLF